MTVDTIHDTSRKTYFEPRSHHLNFKTLCTCCFLPFFIFACEFIWRFVFLLRKNLSEQRQRIINPRMTSQKALLIMMAKTYHDNTIKIPTFTTLSMEILAIRTRKNDPNVNHMLKIQLGSWQWRELTTYLGDIRRNPRGSTHMRMKAAWVGFMTWKEHSNSTLP